MVPGQAVGPLLPEPVETPAHESGSYARRQYGRPYGHLRERNLWLISIIKVHPTSTTYIGSWISAKSIAALWIT